MKLTKLALEQINARLANDNAELRAQLAGLQHDFAIVKAEFEQINAQVATTLAQHKAARVAQHSDEQHKAARVVPAWQAQRAIDMAEARTIAMATGRVIKV